jgi:hypothetical protein
MRHGGEELEVGVGQVTVSWREAALDLGAEPVTVGRCRAH